MTYGIEYDNDGVAFMVGRKALMMTDGMVLSAFGGRQAFPGETDVIMDSGCTTSGCVPSSHDRINLRPPEIDSLTVGNAEWCPAESTGDLVVWCINTDLSVKVPRGGAAGSGGGGGGDDGRPNPKILPEDAYDYWSDDELCRLFERILGRTGARFLANMPKSNKDAP